VAQMRGRRLVGGLVVALIVVFGNAAGASVSAFPTGGLLVFGCDCTVSGEDLFTIAPDGRGLRMLPGTDAGSSPRWSRDGRTIAFVRHREMKQSIWLYSANESTARRLTRPGPGAADESPAWSPRGDVLAFVRRSDQNPASALRTLGTASRKWAVVHSGRATLFQPDWSHDGRRIVGRRNGKLWQVHSDGSGLRPLAPRSIRGSLPRWSPDGTRVAFIDVDHAWVRVLDLRSGRATTIFNPEEETYDVGYRSWGLAWSPDGRWLAVLWTAAADCVDDPTTQWCEQPQIWIVNVNDARHEQIYAGPLFSYGYALDWGPGR
jgi:Tol biopolymer transport system component